MGLQNATILDGATISAAGGTSKTLSVDGIPVTNGIHLSDFSVADLRVRPNVTAKNRPAAYNKTTAKWTKGKRESVFAFPKILADGSIEYPLVRIEVEDHPEMTDAELTKMFCWAAQVFFDPDFVNFMKYGSLA